MPGAPFAAEVLEATAACDDVMAELFTLTVMTRVSNTGSASPDSTKMPIPFYATFRDPDAKSILPNGYDIRSDLRPGVQSSHPRVQISPAQIALLPTPFVIKKDDLLTRDVDGKVWGVNSVSVSTGGIVRAFVNLVG